MGLYDRDYMRKDKKTEKREENRILDSLSELFHKLQHREERIEKPKQEGVKTEKERQVRKPDLALYLWILSGAIAIGLFIFILIKAHA